MVNVENQRDNINNRCKWAIFLLFCLLILSVTYMCLVPSMILLLDDSICEKIVCQLDYYTIFMFLFKYVLIITMILILIIFTIATICVFYACLTDVEIPESTIVIDNSEPKELIKI